MIELLAHAGEQHGPDLGLVALLVAAAVLGVLLLGSALARQRAARPTRRHR